MKPLAALTAIAVLLISLSYAHAQDDAATTLKQFGEFMVGTWTPADQEDKAGPRKHIYSWTPGRKFLQTDGRIDPIPWDGFCGVDPKSKKLTWWGFFADGTAGPIYLIESTDRSWVFEGDGVGPEGKTRRRVTAIKTGDTTLTGKVEDIVGGATTLVEETKWVRHR